jgi:hypothetical protein
MLILFGLIHAKRRRALMALLWGILAMAALQKLAPQAASPERHAGAAAWVHALQRVAVGIQPLSDRFEAVSTAVDSDAYAPMAMLGNPGEGWFPYPTQEVPTIGR